MVALEPTEAQRREGMVTARLSDGAVIFAPLHWIGPIVDRNRAVRAAEPQQSAGDRLLARRAARWMAVETEWVSVAAPGDTIARVPSDPGSWYVIIDIPPGSEGKDITLDGRRLATGWIRPAPFAPPRRSESASGGWLSACIVAARRSPFLRWRARLATGEPLVASGPARDEFLDTGVESLAEQIESQWAEALDRLSAADVALASEVRRRLALRVNFSGTDLPAWPTLDASLTKLQEDLLSPLLGPAARVQRAREWMQSQPKYASWVADDAAIIDSATGRPAASVMGVVLDPGSGAAAMMLTSPAASRPQEILTLAPAVAGRALLPLPPAPADDASLTINIAGWTARRAVLPAALPARPPGLLLSGFFDDWTLPDWLASCTDSGDLRTGQSPAGRGGLVAADDRRTAALLYAEEPVGAGAAGDAPRQWTLYLECRRPTGSPPDRSDEVLVGISGHGGDVVLRVYPDGLVVTSRGTSSRAPAESGEDRWKVWVPIPDSAVAGSAFIRLGICRSDSSGLRSSWPRPMFPWEELPARAAIDLQEWTGLGERAP